MINETTDVTVKFLNIIGDNTKHEKFIIKTLFYAC